MKAVPIGKGMYRIIVHSKEKRKRLSKIPEVIVEDNRVIFPEWLTSNIKQIVEPLKKKKNSKIKQTKLL